MRLAKLVCAAAFVCLSGTVAEAGVYSDDLGKCLVKSSSPQDQSDLVVWVFSAMSLNPAVRAYTTLTDAQRDAMSRKAAALMTRLLTSDCRTEAVAALKYEGGAAIETSFSLLGEVAVRGLMNDPDVNKAMETLGGDMDKEKLQALLKEAGVAVKDDSASSAAPAK